jgi:hypothetical protein
MREGGRWALWLYLNFAWFSMNKFVWHFVFVLLVAYLWFGQICALFSPARSLCVVSCSLILPTALKSFFCSQPEGARRLLRESSVFVFQLSSLVWCRSVLSFWLAVLRRFFFARETRRQIFLFSSRSVSLSARRWALGPGHSVFPAFVCRYFFLVAEFEHRRMSLVRRSLRWRCSPPGSVLPCSLLSCWPVRIFGPAHRLPEPSAAISARFWSGLVSGFLTAHSNSFDLCANKCELLDLAPNPSFHAAHFCSSSASLLVPVLILQPVHRWQHLRFRVSCPPEQALPDSSLVWWIFDVAAVHLDIIFPSQGATSLIFLTKSWLPSWSALANKILSWALLLSGQILSFSPAKCCLLVISSCFWISHFLVRLCSVRAVDLTLWIGAGQTISNVRSQNRTIEIHSNARSDLD